MFFHDPKFYKNGKDYHGIAPAQIKNSSVKNFYFEELKKCSGKIVNDIGAGNGILSIKASMFGAEQVNAFETNDDVAEILKYSIDKLKLNNICIKNMHVTGHESFDGVIVCEMINLSFRNNTFPEFMMNIAKANPEIESIPNSFTYVGRLIKDPSLNDRVDWGYDTEINSVFDEIALNYLIANPIRRYNIDRNKKNEVEIISAIDLISYNFGCRTIYSNSLILPENKEGLWLEVNWKLNHSYTNDGIYWPLEYIPLFNNKLENCSIIDMVSDSACHKLKFI